MDKPNSWFKLTYRFKLLNLNQRLGLCKINKCYGIIVSLAAVIIAQITLKKAVFNIKISGKLRRKHNQHKTLQNKEQNELRADIQR